ncbi:MAG: signal peptidase I [Verrucomicrobiota bacterium]
MGTLVFGRHPKRTAARIAIVVVAAILFFAFVQPIRVTGISMFPTYKDRQINFVNKLSYLRSHPERGDVVAVRDPGSGVILLKRVIGLPGEEVAIERGMVYINGKELDEKAYVKARQPWTELLDPLPPECYFVIGDNRSMPVTAHTHGVYHRTNIIGRVLF